MNVFITGVSSGLGKALKDKYINLGHNVYGISRSKVNDCNYISCDLENLDGIESKLWRLFRDVSEIDLVILNAGMLGEIKTFDEWTIEELNKIMNVNVWSNKIILDWLLSNRKIHQVISISSGASEHTYKGWSGYSLSKSSLRMMMEVYSKEIKGTHFISLAPGLVDTKMQNYLCNDVDVDKFAVMKKFIKSREDGTTRKPLAVAKDIIDLVPSLSELDNGSFIDLRNK